MLLKWLVRPRVGFASIFLKFSAVSGIAYNDMLFVETYRYFNVCGFAVR